MNVKNRKCIRKLSLKSLYANRRRNLIAIFAIALTTMLFTSMFTIVLSLNASYETYQFRQVGGYAHGTFKDVSPEQAERIAAHPKVKAAGARKVIGITVDGVFSKTPAEISYMDANCTKWSYATPTTGRMWGISVIRPSAGFLCFRKMEMLPEMERRLTGSAP